jgi:hypothetical protein
MGWFFLVATCACPLRQTVRLFLKQIGLNKIIMTTNPSSLRIGLLDNSAHSLQRGYELWYQGQTTHDGWVLKEAIFWIHHGVELALKQLLVQTNEYLVFDKIDDAVRKLTHLRRQNGMANAGVLDLFNQDESGIVSVSFHNLVQRVAIMLNIRELEEGAPLRTYIDELTKYRNKIVHFSIEMNVSEISSLLSDVLEPLLQLLAREVKDANFKTNSIPAIRRRAQPIQTISHNYEIESISRIERLLCKFNGQTVSGELFGLDDDVVLPVFTNVNQSPHGSRDYGLDIHAKSASETWLIELKSRLSLAFIDRILLQLNRASQFAINSKIWLVVMSDVSPVYKERIKEKGIQISSIDDIVRLEQLLL